MIPKPKGEEKGSDYIKRCMADNTMNSEFPDQKQRAAVCYNEWREAKKEEIVNKLNRILKIK